VRFPSAAVWPTGRLGGARQSSPWVGKSASHPMSMALHRPTQVHRNSASHHFFLNF
jgi:hypothetical protein